MAKDARLFREIFWPQLGTNVLQITPFKMMAARQVSSNLGGLSKAYRIGNADKTRPFYNGKINKLEEHVARAKARRLQS